MERKLLALTAGAIVASAALAGDARDARADGEVSPKGKGIVGGALLGGEVVDITMAIIGVRSGWPYLVVGAVGAAGGGIGGYFVEKGSSAEPAVYMLAGGMALFIPALVASLNATSYRPPESDQTEPSTNQPSKEPPNPKAGVSVTAQASPRRHASQPFVAHIPVSLVDLHAGRVALGLPAFELRPSYSQREIAMYGVEQRTELRVPLFQASF